jgi:signal transduction histidine kinase
LFFDQLLQILKLKIMTTPSTALQREATAPLTHIFLSLDLMESNHHDDETRRYLAIIRQNTERLQRLIQHAPVQILAG